MLARLGPMCATVCIHTSGASIEAPRPAKPISGRLAADSPILGVSRYSGSSAMTANTICR